MRSFFNGALLVFVLVFLVGCGTTGKGKAGKAGAETGTDVTTSGFEGAQGADMTGIQTQGIGPGGEFGEDPLHDPQSPLADRVIYFPFDNSQVQPEYEPVVSAHGQFLANHQNLKITLEGHADERGSREYNIALGEQRAKSVAKMMKLQGVSDDQIQIISYGEEKPAAYEHDEEAWRLNRRVEITYPGY